MVATIGNCSDSFPNASEVYSLERQHDALIACTERLLQSSSKIDNQQHRLATALSASNSALESLRDQLKKIRSAPGTDPLTELPNRQEFMPLLAKAIGETARRGMSLCLVVGDIDNFTAFNENWGYDRGDQVLRLVAAEMKRKVGQSGTVVRSRGAQFAIILPDASVNEAGAIAENIYRSVMKREVRIRSTEQRLGRIGMSFGIASARLGDTPEALAARSRACLRMAKSPGCHRVIGENDPAMAHVALEAAKA
jgi:diguanylate cyclase (GGDEF)-like protein